MESQAFRDAVATQAATIDVKLNTSLTEWWNVFDGGCIQCCGVRACMAAGALVL